MISARYSISALVASDLVPCTVRLGDFLYLPVTGSLPSATLMRHVFFLPVFSTDPMPDNELLPDISYSFPSVRMGKKAPPKTGRVKRRLLTPLPVFGHSTQTYCYGQIWANFGLKC